MDTFNSSELAKSEFAIKTGLSWERIKELRNFAERVESFLHWKFEEVVEGSPLRYRAYNNDVVRFLSFLRKNRFDLSKVIGETEVSKLERGLLLRQKKLRPYWQLVGSQTIKL